MYTYVTRNSVGNSSAIKVVKCSFIFEVLYLKQEIRTLMRAQRRREKIIKRMRKILYMKRLEELRIFRTEK